MFPDDNDPAVLAEDQKFNDFWSTSLEPTDEFRPQARSSSNSRRFVAGVCTAMGLLVGAVLATAGSGPSSAALQAASDAGFDQVSPTMVTIASDTVPTTLVAVPTTTSTSSLAPESEALAVEPLEPQTQPSTDPDPARRLTESDFVYLGAFMAPADDIGNSTFAYGGRAATFNPYGDPGNTDAYGGSLFLAGHPLQNPGIAEIDIPEPKLHRGSTEGLPVASVLQPFADVTNGRAMDYIGSSDVGGIDEFRFGGLEVVDNPSGPRLHWTAWQYYHVTDSDVPSHGHSSLDLLNPGPQGPWFLSNYGMGQTSGYVFTAPSAFADEHLDGHGLVSGFQHDATNSKNSWGPPFFAYSAPDQAEPLTRLDALELVNYPYPKHQLRGHEQTNLTPGADWVTASNGAEAIVVTGHESLEGSRYGVPESDDCNSSSGYLGAPYAPRVMFYDPADLAQVANGQIQPWDVEPYRTWNPMDYLIPTCDWLLSSLSFDESTGRMYIVQPEADLSQNIYAPVPVIHVFDVN